MQRQVLVVLSIVAMCGQLIAAQKPHFDESLAHRSDDYFRAVESHRYDLIWDLSSATVHQEFGNDFNEFEEHLTSEPPVLVEFKTLSVLADGSKGYVCVRITTVSQTDQTRDSELYDCLWIQKDGDWFLESMVDEDSDVDGFGNPLPPEVAQQARATERAQRRLTGEFTAVARAR